MGYASCLENDIEKTMDRAFMAQRFQEAPRPATLIKATMPKPRPIIIVAPLPPAPVIPVEERRRREREIHVLCLSELKPKANRYCQRHV